MSTDFDQRRVIDSDSLVAGKIPPQDVEAEKAVLGAMLLDRHAVSPAIELLQPDYFYSNANQRIFDAMLGLYTKNVEIDVITLREELRRVGDLENVGGSAYLNDLVSSVVSSANIEAHSQIVAEKYMLRTLITSMSQNIQKCFDNREDAFGLIDEVEREYLQSFRSAPEEGDGASAAGDP